MAALATHAVFALQAELTPLPPGLNPIRTILALAAVAALLGVMVWSLRRSGWRGGGARGTSRIAIETSMALGDRRSLMVVLVDARRLLIGVTPAQVSLVTELQGQAPEFAPVLDRRMDEGR